MIPSVAPPTPVLMLTMNSLALTKAAVASVLAQDVPVWLLVVDNGSIDGTREWLRTQPVDVVAFNDNIGVSAAWNHGLRYLLDQCKHEAVLVVNNDVVLRFDTVRELLADGGEFVTCVSVDSLAKSQEPWTKAPRPHPDFSAWLIRRSVWEHVGEFDAKMVVYASDGDYHLRMHRAGIAAYTIGIPFYHYASGTLKSSTADVRAELCKRADADRAEFQRKWGVAMGSAEYERLFATAQVAAGPAAPVQP